MILLAITILGTIGVSCFCSILEAMLLSTTTAEIESLKKSSSRKGHLMERMKIDIESSSASILTLNTIANTLGSVCAGGLVTQIYGDNYLLGFSLGMTVTILFFSEILPKNIGVYYRRDLLPVLVYPLYLVRFIMGPFAKFCSQVVRILIRPKNDPHNPEEEILILAEKSAREGALSVDEKDMISNALMLDEIVVKEVMTPRTVITAYESTNTVEKTLNNNPIIPFGRIPVYKKSIDNIVGIVRRKDLLSYKQKGSLEETQLGKLAQQAFFIPETSTLAKTLNQFLKKHQQMAIAVDEFGSVTGVITLEDIFEHIIGKEIFEKDDVAIDMRALAREQVRKDIG